MQRRFQRDTEEGARNDAALEEVRRLFKRYRLASASGRASSDAEDRGPAARAEAQGERQTKTTP
jgi:hypothetical protein